MVVSRPLPPSTEQNARHLESVYRTCPDFGEGLAGDRHLHGTRCTKQPDRLESGQLWNVGQLHTEDHQHRKLFVTAWWPARSATSSGAVGSLPMDSQLAVFANAGDIHGDPTAQLAIVNTRSGSLKLC